MSRASTPALPGDEDFIETDADAAWVHAFLLRWEAHDPALFGQTDGDVFRMLARNAAEVYALLPPDCGLVSRLLDSVRETWHALAITIGLRAWQAGYAAGVAAERTEGEAPPAA